MLQEYIILAEEESSNPSDNNNNNSTKQKVATSGSSIQKASSEHPSSSIPCQQSIPQQHSVAPADHQFFDTNMNPDDPNQQFPFPSLSQSQSDSSLPISIQNQQFILPNVNFGETSVDSSHVDLEWMAEHASSLPLGNINDLSSMSMNGNEMALNMNMDMNIDMGMNMNVGMNMVPGVDVQEMNGNMNSMTPFRSSHMEETPQTLNNVAEDLPSFHDVNGDHSQHQDHVIQSEYDEEGGKDSRSNEQTKLVVVLPSRRSLRKRYDIDEEENSDDSSDSDQDENMVATYGGKRASSSKGENSDASGQSTPESIDSENIRRSRRSRRKSRKLLETDEVLYCLCRKPNDGSFMIQCDKCSDWFHGACVNVTEEESSHFETYVCPPCSALPSDVQVDRSSAAPPPSNVDSKQRRSKRKLDASEDHFEDEELQKMKRQNFDGMAGYNKSSKESDNICSDSSVMKSKSSKDHSSSDKSSAGIHKSDKVEGDVKSTGRPKLKLRTGSVSSSRSSLTKNDKKSSSSSLSATSTTPVSAKHQRSDSSHRDNIVKFLTSAIESIFKDYMSDPVNSAELVSKDPSYPKTLAESLEAELFALYPDSDTYKAKVRSIRANLKDAKNDLVRRKFILTGEWSAAELAKMTPEQMNLEYQKLAEEIRIETMKSSIITDISRIPITKKTHKGEQEIESFGVRKAQLPEPEQRPITFVPNEEDSMDAATQSAADRESGDHSRSRSHSRTPSISTSKYDIDHATGEHLEGDDQQEEFESPYEFKYNEDSIGLLDSIDIPVVQSPTSKEFTDTSPEVSEDTAMPIPSTSRSSSASLMAETPSAKTKINPLDILSSIPSSTPVSNSNNGVVSTPKPRLSITKTVVPTVPVWSGTIQSLNPAFSFNTDVIQAAGRVLPMSSQSADPWSSYLPKEFVIGGKIPDDKVTPYITQSISSKNREVFVFRILPPSDVEGYQSYKTLFDLFHSRRRYAVVTERGEAKELRDFYICMFGPRDELPEWIENLENADNISDIRSDEWMMGVIVVNREKKADSGSGTPQVPSVTRQEVNTAAWDQPEPTTSAAAEPAYRVSPPRSPGRKVQPALPQAPLSTTQPPVPVNPAAAFDPSALQNLLSSLNPSAPPSSSQLPNAPTAGHFPGNPPINMLNMFANLPNLQNFPNLPNLPNFPNMPNLNMMANLGFTNPPTQGMPSSMPYQQSQQQPSQQQQQQNQYSRGGYGGGDRRSYGNERGRGGGYSGSRSKGSSRGSGGENVNGYPGWDREKEQQKERRGPYTRGGGRGGNRGRGSKSGGRGRGGSNW